MAEKKASAKAKVRVNRVDENVDEVFIYSDEPYVNKAIYAKTGTFTAGEFSLEDIEKLEKKDAKARQPDGTAIGKIEPAKG